MKKTVYKLKDIKYSNLPIQESILEDELPTESEIVIENYGMSKKTLKLLLKTIAKDSIHQNISAYKVEKLKK